MSHEYELKLAFIKQFPLFIQWPQEHVEHNEFVIGIYGTNHFKPFLKDLEIRSINDKPMQSLIHKNLREDCFFLHCTMILKFCNVSQSL